MGADTKIQWATHTFNPWRGCAKIASGCANCYADAQSRRNPRILGVWGPNGTRVVASEAMWREPIKWDRDAAKTGKRPRVFCASLADVFEDWRGEVRDSHGGILHACESGHWSALSSVYAYGHACLHCQGFSRVATLNDVRARLFATIDATPNLNWLLLTKRIENARRMIPWMTNGSSEASPYFAAWQKRDNVWLGVSISRQDDADRLIPELLKCRGLCGKTFLSIEPLIEEVNLRRFFAHSMRCASYRGREHGFDTTWRPCDCGRTRIDWVIVGGESGPNARPCNVDWLWSIVRQCRNAGVPPFVKQAGSRVVDMDLDSGEAFADEMCWPEGTKTDGCRVLLRDKKGGDLSELPEDLRVREVPK